MPRYSLDSQTTGTVPTVQCLSDHGDCPHGSTNVIASAAKPDHGDCPHGSINKLVYYEVFNDIKFAIEREKQIKGGSRKKKIELIDGFNKDWEDSYPKL